MLSRTTCHVPLLNLSATPGDAALSSLQNHCQENLKRWANAHLDRLAQKFPWVCGFLRAVCSPLASVSCSEVSVQLCAEALRIITPLNKPALDSLQFLQVICEDIPHLVRCNRQIFLLLLYQTNKTETKCLRPCDLTARPSVLAVIEMLRRLLPEWRWTVFLESNGEN